MLTFIRILIKINGKYEQQLSGFQEGAQKSFEYENNCYKIYKNSPQK